MIGIVASGRSVVIHAGGSCHDYDAIKPLRVAERLHADTARRDRIIRERLRAQGHTVIEIDANQLHDVDAMAAHFAKLARNVMDRREVRRIRDDRSWFDVELPAPPPLSSEEIGAELHTRGCRLFHAINLRDFEVYCGEKALLSRAELEGSGEAFTPFSSDETDKERGLWARTFGNLADFGYGFWKWGGGINVYGPIVLVFRPEVFDAVHDLALTLENAATDGFDLAERRIQQREDLRSLFQYPADHLRGDWLTKGKRFVEVSVSDRRIGFEHLEKIIVEPVEIGGVRLLDRVQALLNAAGLDVPVDDRSTLLQYKDRVDDFAALVQWAVEREGKPGQVEETLPPQLQGWYAGLGNAQSAVYRWAEYLWPGTITLCSDRGTNGASPT